MPREPDEAHEDRDGGEEAGDRLRRPLLAALVEGLAFGVQRSAILAARAAARRAAARARAEAVVARPRRVRDHPNPGRASASPRLRLDRIPNHVAEICDG